LVSRAKILGLGLCIWAGCGAASAPELPDHITGFDLPADPGYEQAVRFSRLQSELVYIDRLAGPIPMDGLPLRQAPDAIEGEGDGGSELFQASQLVSRVALGILVLFTLVALIKGRRGLMHRLGRTQAGAGATGGAAQAIPDPPAENHMALIERLRTMEDREQALVALIEAALASAANQNRLRLGRSETARELLRRLPRSWPHISGLRRLVMTEELVQFGGRPLPESTFEDCLRRALPILRAGETAR
jgi:hypothetical protein